MSQVTKNKLALMRKIMLAGRAGGTSVSIPKPMLHDILALAFDDCVDSDWYIERYPDVGMAIAKGVVSSASEHYFTDGIFEGRIPCPVPLDDDSYLKSHKDVARSVRDGRYKTGLEHFLVTGYIEGRQFDLTEDQA